MGRVHLRENCTAEKILNFLSDGNPRTSREIAEGIGARLGSVSNRLYELWRDGLVLRTKVPILGRDRFFHGRIGTFEGTCRRHSYMLAGSGGGLVTVGGLEFVSYFRRNGVSKSLTVLNFLKENKDKAFYSADVYEALKEKLERIGAVMDATRYYERKGIIYVRGYRTGDKQTPFQRGFIITYIDEGKPSDEAVREAVERTEQLLIGEQSSSNRLNDRIRHIRNTIVASTHINELTSYNYLRHQINCTEHELEHALWRLQQLYIDIRVVKLFGAYRFYYHSSMLPEVLKMAIERKTKYVQKTQGRAHRIGHNWEAAVEWFIDHFIEYATFLEQKHHGTGRIDPRRITLYLTKSVGNRRNWAEVDRVWTISDELMKKPTTYVLSCKWGLVHKKDLDDFMEVLKWSREFGTDTHEGRAVKNNVIGVFAAGAFNPTENVQLANGDTITLPSYAGRLSINIIKAANLNTKLREQGTEKEITVQKICRVARDEAEVRKIIDEIWDNPTKAAEILSEATSKNQDIYQFEKLLESKEPDINMATTNEGEAAVQPAVENKEEEIEEPADRYGPDDLSGMGH